VVVWDKIVLKGENYKLDLKGAKTKYYLWDDGDGLR
jgi:signal peptidase complex subunit 3